MSGLKENSILNGGYSTFINGKDFTFHQGLNKSLDEIKYQIEETLEYARNLEDKNKELEDAHWKDDKLQEMKKKYDRAMADYNRGFPITEDETLAINNWRKNRINKMHNGSPGSSAIGGGWTYKFTPTSIGVIGSVCCESCYHNMKKELGFESNYNGYTEYSKKQRELNEKYDAEFVFREIL